MHFKGKGFYNTDYGTRKRQRETAAAAEGSSGKKDSSSDGGQASDKDATGQGRESVPRRRQAKDAKPVAAKKLSSASRVAAKDSTRSTDEAQAGR